MRCIESDVIPEHISGHDRKRILKALLDEPIEIQLQVYEAEPHQTGIIFYETTVGELKTRIKAICKDLDIVYDDKPYTKNVGCLRFKDIDFSLMKQYDSASVMELTKSLSDITNEDKVDIYDTLTKGWGGKGFLMYISYGSHDRIPY